MTTRANNESGISQHSYLDVRGLTVELCAPLEIEDHVVQTCENVSPPKWHLAHTTWFFETFILEPFARNFKPFNPLFRELFNSYYVNVGDRHPRPNRGLLSRPTVQQVLEYRRNVDQRMVALMDEVQPSHQEEVSRRLCLGLQHEQQHQELLIMDLKHILSMNPSHPVYQDLERPAAQARPSSWVSFEGGIREIGYQGSAFAYDNERPQHSVLLQSYSLADRCVTNGEFIEWIESGAYRTPTLWLSDAWAYIERESWEAPLYWRNVDGTWYHFTLQGLKPVDVNEPVVHISFFEAEAFARWRGCRLPTEFEWEHAAARLAPVGHFAESRDFHPRSSQQQSPGGSASEMTAGEFTATDLCQMFGDVWEATSSPYISYPGYKAEPGALGEYNGKFMSGQMVLRGGSCATSQSHIRNTYRNFFYPHERWMFQGLRLAKDSK